MKRLALGYSSGRGSNLLNVNTCVEFCSADYIYIYNY